MFKLLVLAVSMIAMANSAVIKNLAGGIVEAGADNNVLEIARWTTTSMHQFSGIEGDHTVLTVRNGKKAVN
jgi:hypothetical protein